LDDGSPGVSHHDKFTPLFAQALECLHHMPGFMGADCVGLLSLPSTQQPAVISLLLNPVFTHSNLPGLDFFASIIPTVYIATMPAYRSVGIKATLSTSSLQQSLEKQFISTAVASHNEKNASHAGRPAMWRDLQERPIDVDGNCNGVMHFIGLHGDMAFFMVEAAEDLHATDVARRSITAPCHAKQNRRFLATDLATPKDTLRRSRSFDDFSDDLGISNGANSTGENVRDKTSAARPRLRETSVNALTHSSKLTQKEPIASKDPALLLRVDIQDKGEPPKWPRAQDNHMLPHLKVEVFLHGELAEVVFLNKSRNAVQLHGDMLVFYGTRAARQLEKPWIYRGNHSIGDVDMTAAQRWSTYQEALSAEARLRGTNIYGSLPPSAEFLQALSVLDLPDHLQSHANLSVIDVVITTGTGFKYGYVRMRIVERFTDSC
jgi:hypothetical protein